MLRKQHANRKKGVLNIFKGAKSLKLAWTEIVALIIVVFCLGFILGRMSGSETISYDGLGEHRMVPMHNYSSNCFYYDDNGWLYYDDDDYTSEQWIDVSYVQKDIDWEQVKEAGIDHAMIRLGFRGYETGGLSLDAYFETNAKASRKAGVEAGVYFFSQAVSVEEAIEEAQFVVKNLKGKKLKGPVAFDMEPIEGADRISYLTSEEKTAIADAFMRYIKKKGYEPMLYGNPTWLGGSVDRTLLTDYDVWLAHYTDYTNYPYEFSMWQYTSTGTVAGIEGDVDMNVRIIEK